MTSSDTVHKELELPPLPSLATPCGFDLVSVSGGSQSLATLATCFEKVLGAEQLRESFSIFSGKGGKSGYAAQGDLRAMQKSASQRAPHRVQNAV
jgi:hypothetical protein